MEKATIIFKHEGTIYEGGTARGKTVERAILNALKKTKFIDFYIPIAIVDGAEVEFDKIYNTSTGEDMIILK